MIGCEPVCGKCEACQCLLMALVAGGGVHPAPSPTPNACLPCAVRDPSALAELLARALRGRGVDATSVRQDPRRWYVFGGNVHDCVYIADRDTADLGGQPGWRALAMPEARAALARVLATDTAEAAIAALEGR